MWMHVLMAWVFDGSSLMPLVLRMCPRYWISLTKKWHLQSLIDKWAFHIFQKLAWCGLGVPLPSCWRWLYHSSKQQQKQSLLGHLSWVPGNMQVLGWVGWVIWHIHIFQMVRWRLFWVLMTHPIGCGDILLIYPRLRSILHHWVGQKCLPPSA